MTVNRDRRKRATLIGTGVAALVAIIVLIGYLTGFGQYVDGFLQGTKPADSLAIGENVTVDGSSVPDGIVAKVADPSVVLPPDVTAVQFGEFVTPMIDIGPSGPLSAPATLTFGLDQPVSVEDVALVFASPDGSPESWDILQAEILPDQLHARVSVEHFSYYQVYTPRAGQTARQIVDDVYVAYNNFAEVTPSSGVAEPNCDRESGAVSDGYTVQASDKDTVLWCIGINGDGSREFKITNNRSYPFELKTDGGLVVTSNGGNDYNLSSAATFGAEIVFPGKTALVAVGDLAQGQRGSAWTQLSDLAVGLKMAQVIVEIIAAIMTGGRSTEAADKSAQVLRLALQAAECIEGLADSPSLESFLVACFKEAVTTAVFGLRPAKMFGFVELAIKTQQAARAVFNTVGDVANGRGEYRLTVSRQGALDRFDGLWTRRGSEFEIRSDGTATQSVSQDGDCAGLAEDCFLVIDMTLEVVDGGQRLVGTYTRVWYSGADSAEELDVPPSFLVDAPRAGDKTDLRIGTLGNLLDIPRDPIYNGGDMDGDGELDYSVHYCQSGLSREALYNCGE